MTYDQKIPIGIIGTGTIGMQIAYEVLRHGHPVTLKTRSEERAERAMKKMEATVERFLGEEGRPFMDAFMVTTDYADLADSLLVVEAVVENLDVKREVFLNLGKIADADAILATNTSSLSIDLLAACCPNPGRVVGMHFFNPVHRMRLVEIVLGENTLPEVAGFIEELSESLGKTTVRARNSPGFIVNRMLIPQINEAIRMFETGVANLEDIDTAAKLGLNHPMGPFELADYIGLDVCLSILNTLSEDGKVSRFRPAKSLTDLVAAGKLGRKTGEGFYSY